MAKVLNEYEKEYRRAKLRNMLNSEVDFIIRKQQSTYEIKNGECPPELGVELDLAVEKVVEVMEKILDLQIEIDNRGFYAINFKEALDKLKCQIDRVSDIAHLLDGKEMEAGE